ncbi:hypothetical protein GGX14DRAFT_457394 [Mycena pura]|uniref:NmrA-like domain-containing protein n=1 Tax=Mycena pura TaxID=153505 RepID=A0AAD6V9R2_9AGAR|nr:hypothetical protein GGX14DRAFT_457394 [Mycena pura]
MKKVLFIGGTGYIGGPILSRLIEHDDPHVRITALVRSPEKATKLKALNVHVDVVAGSHDDAPLVEELAANADVIFSLASSDNLPAVESMLRGLKKRSTDTGVKPSLIHLVSCLCDDAQGMFASEKVYNDLDIASIESIPATQWHRNVDLALVAADAEGYVNTYIVLPSAVYGTPRGLLMDAGVQNPANFAWTHLISVAFKRGAMEIVGEGRNLVTHVDLAELVDLVVLVYETAQAGRVGHGREGYYFSSKGDVAFARIAEVIEARAGPRRVLTQAEVDEHFPGSFLNEFHYWLGANTRGDAARGRTLG